MSGCYFGWTIVIGFYKFTLVQGASNPNVPPGSYCYDNSICGENTWVGVCNTGHQQSPIDINLMPFIPNVILPTEFKLNQRYTEAAVDRYFVQNNGHTVEFTLRRNISDLTSDLEISGGGLNDAYRFAQFHFYWAMDDSRGSEHRINGKSYPLELHLVHHKSNYTSLSDALSTNDREAVAVMAVFFKISLFTNEVLTPIMTAINSLQLPSQEAEFNIPLRISDIYPIQLEFVRYLGSLTTPTCDEKVIWTVFLRPVEISQAQIEIFRSISNQQDVSDFNYRNPKPLNGRKLKFYRAKSFKFQSVSMVSTFSMVFNFLRMLFSIGESLIIRLVYYSRPYLLIPEVTDLLNFKTQ